MNTLTGGDERHIIGTVAMLGAEYFQARVAWSHAGMGHTSGELA